MCVGVSLLKSLTHINSTRVFYQCVYILFKDESKR